jgi:hypothetical protein
VSKGSLSQAYPEKSPPPGSLAQRGATHEAKRGGRVSGAGDRGPKHPSSGESTLSLLREDRGGLGCGAARCGARRGSVVLDPTSATEAHSHFCPRARPPPTAETTTVPHSPSRGPLGNQMSFASAVHFRSLSDGWTGAGGVIEAQYERKATKS